MPGTGRTTLLQRFTLVTAAIAVGLAVVLSALAVRAIESFAVKDEAQVAAELVLRAIAPQLRPGDFAGALPPQRRALFDNLFKARGISDRILRVRLWRADGRLLYTNGAESPEAPPTPADLATAAGYHDFVRRRRGVEEPAPGIARVFVPVQIAGTSGTLGAFEIFYDMTLLNQRLAHIRRTVWTAVPLGLFVLYASVFVLVRRASRQLLKQQADLIAAHLGTYQALATAIDARDSYTGDHSIRVADLCERLGRALGLDARSLDELRAAGRLHDLGKIGVPDAVLVKPGPLTPAEAAVMRRHAEAGHAIVQGAPLPERVKQAVRSAHERWDGTGYPDGLAGATIPLFARIVAVVDAYQAMTDERPYREAVAPAEALRRLEAAAGSQFDPEVVAAFARMAVATDDAARWTVPRPAAYTEGVATRDLLRTR